MTSIIRLMESIERQALQDFLPRLVILESKWLKNRNQEDFDKFGDSYIAKISKDEFIRQLDFMEKVTNGGIMKSITKSTRDEFYNQLSLPRLFDGDTIKLSNDIDKDFGESVLSWLGSKVKPTAKRGGFNGLAPVDNRWLLDRISEYQVS